MNFFKNLFIKEEPKWKSRPDPREFKKSEKEEIIPSSEEETKEEIQQSKEAHRHDAVMQDTLTEMMQKSQSFKTLEWMRKNQKTDDVDLVKQNLGKIFPRLKRGSVENSEGVTMMMPTKDGNKEVKIPAELMLAGFDSGPDYCTNLAIDHGAMFTMINKKQVALSGMTKKEILDLASQNFLKKMAPLIKINSTIFPNVYELQTDGNSEASTFLFPNIWINIKQQLNLSKLYLIMPAQNTVLFWEIYLMMCFLI